MGKQIRLMSLSNQHLDVPGKLNMCNNNYNTRLDEQRMMYVYQGLNVVMKLLSRHLDEQITANTPANPSLSHAFANADSGSIIAMAFSALKNGNITRKQYDDIFDIAMQMNTVKTKAESVKDPQPSISAMLNRLLES